MGLFVALGAARACCGVLWRLWEVEASLDFPLIYYLKVVLLPGPD